MRGETPTWGTGAVRRWVALLDHAEQLMYGAAPEDPVAQRTAGRAIDSLFRYEHQLTPRARRRAREYAWRRDRPHEPLPDEATRAEWERCRCPRCRYALRFGGTGETATSGVVPATAAHVRADVA